MLKTEIEKRRAAKHAAQKAAAEAERKAQLLALEKREAAAAAKKEREEAERKAREVAEKKAAEQKAEEAARKVKLLQAAADAERIKQIEKARSAVNSPIRKFVRVHEQPGAAAVWHGSIPATGYGEDRKSDPVHDRITADHETLPDPYKSLEGRVRGRKGSRGASGNLPKKTPSSSVHVTKEE